MSLLIQLLDYYPEGLTLLKKESIDGLDTHNSKVFQLYVPIPKKKKNKDGTYDHSSLHFLRLIKTIEKGAYEVYAYLPDRPEYKLYLGLAIVLTLDNKLYSFNEV